jgi:hypothetical protein
MSWAVVIKALENAGWTPETVIEAMIARRGKRLESRRKTIIKLLRERGQPVRLSEIAALVGIPLSNFSSFRRDEARSKARQAKKGREGVYVEHSFSPDGEINTKWLSLSSWTPEQRVVRDYE